MLLEYLEDDERERLRFNKKDRKVIERVHGLFKEHSYASMEVAYDILEESRFIASTVVCKGCKGYGFKDRKFHWNRTEEERRARRTNSQEHLDFVKRREDMHVKKHGPSSLKNFRKKEQESETRWDAAVHRCPDKQACSDCTHGITKKKWWRFKGYQFYQAIEGIEKVSEDGKVI